MGGEEVGEIAEITMGQSPLGNSYNKNSQGTPLVNGPTEFTKNPQLKFSGLHHQQNSVKEEIYYCALEEAQPGE